MIHKLLQYINYMKSIYSIYNSFLFLIVFLNPAIGQEMLNTKITMSGENRSVIPIEKNLYVLTYESKGKKTAVEIVKLDSNLVIKGQKQYLFDGSFNPSLTIYQKEESIILIDYDSKWLASINLGDLSSIFFNLGLEKGYKVTGLYESKNGIYINTMKSKFGTVNNSIDKTINDALRYYDKKTGKIEVLTLPYFDSKFMYYSEEEDIFHCVIEKTDDPKKCPSYSYSILQNKVFTEKSSISLPAGIGQGDLSGIYLADGTLMMLGSFYKFVKTCNWSESQDTKGLISIIFPPNSSTPSYKMMEYTAMTDFYCDKAKAGKETNNIQLYTGIPTIYNKSIYLPCRKIKRNGEYLVPKADFVALFSLKGDYQNGYCLENNVSVGGGLSAEPTLTTINRNTGTMVIPLKTTGYNLGAVDGITGGKIYDLQTRTEKSFKTTAEIRRRVGLNVIKPSWAGGEYAEWYDNNYAILWPNSKNKKELLIYKYNPVLFPAIEESK